MAARYLYDPILLPGNAKVPDSDFVVSERKYYKDQHGAGALLQSATRLSWKAYGDDDTLTFHTEFAAAAAAVGFQPPQPVQEFVGTIDALFAEKDRVLADVGKQDILAVNGHGNPTGLKLTFKAHIAGQLYCYSVTYKTLAKLLAADGLSKSHGPIVLSGCFGGGVHNEEQLVPAFAQKLAIALGAAGYKKVKVGGTLGAAAPQFRVTILGEGGGLAIGQARAEYFKWYDYRGIAADGPDI